MVGKAILARMDGSQRSAQSADYVIGPSEVGQCRSYLGFMARQTPRDPESGYKLAAYIGTVLGREIEEDTAKAYGWLTEVPTTATYPSGRQISGNADIVIPPDTLGEGDPGAVIDIKTKAGLEFVKRDGPDFSYLAQIQTYLLGLIQAGVLREGAVAHIVYVDRTAKAALEEPLTFTYPQDPEVIAQIEARLDDVEYALAYGEELPKDMPETFCEVACPFYRSCRLPRRHSTGVIEDEGALLAIKRYEEALAMEREARRLKDEAKDHLRSFEGLAGEKVLTWTYVPPTEVPGYTRAGFTRLNLRRAR